VLSTFDPTTVNVEMWRWRRCGDPDGIKAEPSSFALDPKF
jgi:hypothetical protein